MLAKHLGVSEKKADELLSDIKRRHSSLHDVDKHCTEAMAALIKMIKPCTQHGLVPELNAVHNALCALHGASKAKWEAM